MVCADIPGATFAMISVVRSCILPCINLRKSLYHMAIQNLVSRYMLIWLLLPISNHYQCITSNIHCSSLKCSSSILKTQNPVHFKLFEKVNLFIFKALHLLAQNSFTKLKLCIIHHYWKFLNRWMLYHKMDENLKNCYQNIYYTLACM